MAGALITTRDKRSTVMSYVEIPEDQAIRVISTISLTEPERTPNNRWFNPITEDQTWNLKRLIAEDSEEALQNVRTTYGEDALIVSTNKIGTKTEVICAVDLQPDNATFEEDFRRWHQRLPAKNKRRLFSKSQHRY